VYWGFEEDVFVFFRIWKYARVGGSHGETIRGDHLT